ncbi:MAG: LysM peptidoglycan-binding domain-containing protein [Thiobacillaceae bacterium]|nr:LysM peptidoglycan-binding domain-containing protein [Thiobacillaceae bacterium]
MRYPISFTLCLLLALGLAQGARAEQVRLQENAPDVHVVVKGDTLWGISARFLKDPWKWPEVWQLNKAEIRNPHLIYPGDRIRLIRGDQPRLVQEKDIPTVKLTPGVRAEPIIEAPTAIPSVPYAAIAPFLNRGGVMAADELKRAPRVLGTHDDRVIFGRHDTVYVEGSGTGETAWEIVRSGPLLTDPVSGEPLGQLLVHVGEARTLQSGNPQLVRIVQAEQEVLERDRLVPLSQAQMPQLAPQAPDKPVQARVVASLGGVEGAGPYTTVLLNQGRRDGLQVGHVLALYKAGRSLADPRCLRAEKLAFLAGGLGARSDCVPDKDDSAGLPERRVGLAFVYRVFDRVAYALVLGSEEPIYVRDMAKNP